MDKVNSLVTFKIAMDIIIFVTVESCNKDFKEGESKHGIHKDSKERDSFDGIREDSGVFAIWVAD